MDYKLPLKAITLAVCVAPVPWISSALIHSAHCQDALIANGNQVLAVGASSGSIPVANLPAWSGTAAQYHGQTPQYSQNVQFDDAGGLLFFLIDGAVYDRDGYLIADNALMSGCEQCLMPGITQVGVTLVPGSCTRYFIVSAMKVPGSYKNALGYAILDLQMENPHWPGTGRLGRVLSLDDIQNDPELEALYDQWTSEMDFNLTGFSAVNGAVCSINLHDYQYDAGDDEQALHFALYDTDVVGEKKLLLAVDENLIYFYEIREDGIHKLAQLAENDIANSSFADVWWNGNRRKWPGACAFGRTANGDVLFAHTSTSAWSNPVTELPTVYLYQVDFSGTLEFLDHFRTISTTQQTHYVPALAFSPSGQYLYFAQNLSPHLGVIDVQSGVQYDLDAEFSISTPQQLGSCWMGMDKAPSGSDPALYIFSQARRGCITEVDDPVASGGWLEPLTFSGSMANSPISGLANADGVTLPLPDLHNFREQQMVKLSTASDAECCDYVSSLHATEIASTMVQNSISTPWRPGAGNNPFTSGSTVVFQQDLTIQTGAYLYVKDMTWRFAENARLIVERGAFVRFDDCHLTGLNCEAARWPGVRVEGTTTNANQASTDQGRVYLYDSELSNATIGVWCAREDALTNTPVAGYFGGRIHAFNSIFRNCITGVRIQSYDRYIGGIAVPNLCMFQGCAFITDANWPDPGITYPKVHAHLLRANGVQFRNCRFVNQSALLGVNNYLGTGILAHQASFYCDGSSIYTQNMISGLKVGVSVLQSSPQWISTVTGMAVEDNVLGIIDYGDDDNVYTSNRFATLTGASTLLSSSVCLSLFQSERYTVERNTFTKHSSATAPGVGIWFRGPAVEENQIYDNEFTDLNAACVVEGNHVGPSAPIDPTKPGLQLLCGDHENNLVDQLMFQDAYIRHDQGRPIGINKLAGNRFLSSPDCSNTFEVYVDPSHTYSPGEMKVHYFHHEASICRPECIDGSWMETLDHYTLTLPSFAIGEGFDKDLYCDQGDLDVGVGGVVLLLEQYHAKVAELGSAVHAYHGTVDLGETPDLISAITSDNPLYASHYLRDLLLDHEPLSDEVMTAAIHRATPMDPWHLTQVLISNSPLTDGIWYELEESEALNGFFLGLLEQYSQGMSTRRLLEMEISERGYEKTRLQHHLLMALAQDTTASDKLDTLDLVFGADSLFNGARFRYLLRLDAGDHSGAQDLEGGLEAGDDNEVLLAVGRLWADLEGDWTQADSAQRAMLAELAFGSDAWGSAFAWGMLLALEETDSLPSPVLPQMYRMARFPRDRRGAKVAEPLLMAYPNPAHDRVMITLPQGVTTGALEFFDAQGRLVHNLALNGQKAFAEVNVQDWTEGIYLVRLVYENLAVADGKITIVR